MATLISQILTLDEAWDEEVQTIVGEFHRLTHEGYAITRRRGRQLTIPLRPATTLLITDFAAAKNVSYTKASDHLVQAVQKGLRVPGRSDGDQPQVRCKHGFLALKLTATKL